MSINLPKTTFSIIPAQQLAGVTSQRVLITGQLLPTGTAVAGVLINDFPNDGSEGALFDANSHIAGLVREFKKLNQITSLDVIPLADAPGAVNGTALLTFVGNASDDATIFVSIGSKKNLRFQVDIESGDTITEMAASVVIAFGASTNKPFTIASSLGVTTATAENGGTLSNEWGISVEGNIPGSVITITGWSGGTVDPVLTSILDVIGDIRYQTILWPSVYVLDAVQTLLDTRFNTTNDVLDGVAVQVKTDTLANVISYVSTLNSQSLVIVAQKIVNDNDFRGSSTLEFPDVAASQICAIRSLRRTQDALLTDFLTTVSPADQFGGIAISSLPYFNTSLPNLPIAFSRHEFSKTDLDDLGNNGLSVYGPNRSFNGTIFGEFVTTYLTDIAANPDDSFKFLNTVDTSSVIREFFFENFRKRYAQTRLTDGDLIARRDMANESSIRAFCNQLYDELSDETLTQKGTAAKKDYNLNLVIVINVATGTATIDQAPLLVSQLRVILGTIKINFGG